MKVAIYARVSTRKQHVENQIPRLLEEARKRGWDYELFEERESTRKTRPVKAGLLQRLRRRDFDAVCFYKLDRWARSTAEGSTEISELVKKGVGVFDISDGIEFNPDSRSGEIPAMQRFQLNVFLAFAELERDLIRDRTLDGLERARSEGKRLGRPKGRKDTKPRRRSGYWKRYAGNK